MGLMQQKTGKAKVIEFAMSVAKIGSCDTRSNTQHSNLSQLQNVFLSNSHNGLLFYFIVLYRS